MNKCIFFHTSCKNTSIFIFSMVEYTDELKYFFHERYISIYSVIFSITSIRLIKINRIIFLWKFGELESTDFYGWCWITHLEESDIFCILSAIFIITAENSPPFSFVDYIPEEIKLNVELKASTIQRSRILRTKLWVVSSKVTHVCFFSWYCF